MNKGKALKKLIQESNFSQRSLANKLGMNEQYLSQQLKKSDVTDSFLERICEALEVDPESLFLEDQSSYKAKYEKLQAEHLEEKKTFLDKLQALMTENYSLKEKILSLEKEVFKLTQK